MSHSPGELKGIAIAGRVSSVLSILGSFTIIGAFALSRHFRSPIHRIIFYNAFYNLFDSVATMISTSGPAAGELSSLCQFQGFALQMYVRSYSFKMSKYELRQQILTDQVSRSWCALDIRNGPGHISGGLPPFWYPIFAQARDQVHRCNYHTLIHSCLCFPFHPWSGKGPYLWRWDRAFSTSILH